MKIEVYSLSQDALMDRDGRDFFAVKVDGKTVVEFYDGEPEDANMSRDFSDIFKIPELMEKAFTAGKNGETIQIDNFELDSLDDFK